MRIKGSIRNSKTGSPVKGAKVELNVDNFDTYPILSDDNGRFDYQIQGVHRTLDINIEKEGFESKSQTYQIDKPEIEVSVLLDEIYVPPPEVIIPPEVFTPPPPPEKKWYMPIKEFIETNSILMARFLEDKIMEFRKKRGRKEEIENLKIILTELGTKVRLNDKDFQKYEDIISKLEMEMGVESVSEGTFMNWNLEKIKPRRSPFNIDVRVIEGDFTESRDVMSIPKSDRKYHIGEKVNLYFKSEKDCYLTLLNYGTSGKLTVLFPNALFKDNSIKANRIYAIPGRDYPFDYLISGPPGLERIKAIATTDKIDLIKLAYRKDEIFPVSTSASRDISVVAKKIETVEEQKWAEAMCMFEVV